MNFTLSEEDIRDSLYEIRRVFIERFANITDTVKAVCDVLSHSPDVLQKAPEHDIVSAERLVLLWERESKNKELHRPVGSVVYPEDNSTQLMDKLVSFCIKTQLEYREVLALAFLGATGLKPEEAECVVQNSVEASCVTIHYRKRKLQMQPLPNIRSILGSMYCKVATLERQGRTLHNDKLLAETVDSYAREIEKEIK